MIDAMNLMSSLAAANPVMHVTDKEIYGQPYISNVTVMLVLSGLITVLVIRHAADRIAKGKTGSLEDLMTRGTLANIVEAICLYLRDQVFRPVLHHETDRFTPMLWTFFWFILINNLLGLVPILDVTAMLRINSDGHGHYYGIGGTATQSIWVTGALALISFVWFNGTALLRDPIGFLKHLTGGAPVYMWPVMVPVEILGTFVKPFALALRLFANMTGGHIIVATLLGFVVALATGLGAVGHGLAIIPLLGTIAVYFLELLVAFIQAFIFTFLSCLFLGQLVIHHHEGHEEHGEHHGHDSHDSYENAIRENLPHATPEGVDQTKAVPLGRSHAAGH